MENTRGDRRAITTGAVHGHAPAQRHFGDPLLQMIQRNIQHERWLRPGQLSLNRSVGAYYARITPVVNRTLVCRGDLKF
ncbi:MAG TPA: hypothetical protein VG297_20475 [Bryobacteraceae bacterium]|jgi:hypothetical protein|nr:hypothetical protein [Bryobacteraceae bacterium]